jgi:hypothetical protein
VTSLLVRRRPLVVCVLAVAAVLLLIACLWLTDVFLWQRESGGFLVFYAVRSLLLALVAAALLAAFALSLARLRDSRVARRCVAAGLATALSLIALEEVFMFVARSHNVGYTLASKLWYHHHWGMPNALGYRDHEHVPAPGKKIVFMVGDSYAAGAGVEREQRFADVFAGLRPDLQVMNLGVCGLDSVEEYKRLEAHPVHPDVVVLEYYPNDVDGAAKRAGHDPPDFEPYADLPCFVPVWFVRNSFLANFAYWQLPHGDGDAYLRFMMDMEHDPAVSRLQLEDLAKFCTWTNERRAGLVVVLMPLLEDLAWSRTANADVKAFFESQHVPVVDVADLVADLTVAQRLVNHHDGHASRVVHERIGHALAKLIHV